MPKTFQIFQKWRNLPKSGHTAVWRLHLRHYQNWGYESCLLEIATIPLCQNFTESPTNSHFGNKLLRPIIKSICKMIWLCLGFFKGQFKGIQKLLFQKKFQTMFFLFRQLCRPRLFQTLTFSNCWSVFILCKALNSYVKVVSSLFFWVLQSAAKLCRLVHSDCKSCCNVLWSCV